MPQRPRFRLTACTSHTRGVRAVDITFQWRSCRPGAPRPTLLTTQLPTRRLPARFTAALAGSAVNSRCFCPRVRRVPNTDLLQRPGDGAISGLIGFGVRELLLVRVQEARDVAFARFPAEFPVECGD